MIESNRQTTTGRFPREMMDAVHLAWRLALAFAGKRGLGLDDSEDFASSVQLRLLEGDCAILRRFRGESSLRSFLLAVIANLYSDFLDKRRGKWRASASARRSGRTGIALERMVLRDRVSLSQATARLRHAGHEDLTLSGAARLIASFPTRYRRTFLNGAMLGELVESRSADDELWRSERAESLRALTASLQRALEALSPDDRLIVEMRYRDGLSVATIARQLGLPQKPLYRRCERILECLRESSDLRARYVAHGPLS